MGNADHLLASRAPLAVFRDHDGEFPDLLAVKYGGRFANLRDDGRHDLVDVGDLGGAVFYEPEKGARGEGGDVGQWSFGALSVERPEGLRAVLREDEHEPRLKSKRDITGPGAIVSVTPVVDEYRNTYGRPLPLGSVGVLMQASAQSEWSQWLLPSIELVAQHRGSHARGPVPECSTRIHDLTPGGYQDYKAGGGLHSMVKVQQSIGNWQPAWFHARAVDGTGGGLWVGAGDGAPARPQKTVVIPRGGGLTMGLASWREGGPLHPGHASADKHKRHTNDDGEATNSGHIWIDALFYEDQRRDGPKEHGPDYPLRTVDRNIPTKVYEGWDDATGRWRRWTTTPIIPPPWIPWEPPIDHPPPWQPFTPGRGERVPVPGQPHWPRPGDKPGGGGSSGRRPGARDDGLIDFDPSPYSDLVHPVNRRGSVRQLQAGDAVAPDAANPANPALHEQEIGVPSLQFTGARDRDSQPGDGRYGGPGNDTVFPSPSVDDDWDAVDPTWRPSRELTGRRDRRRRHAGRDPLTSMIPTPGRVGLTSRAAQRRGGPTPLSVHLVALPGLKDNSTGLWDYQSEPGAAWGNGTSTWAALVIGPGGLIPDGLDDQADTLGDVDVLMYQGWRGGDVDSVGFGWGRPSQTGRSWDDGVVWHLTGDSDELNLNHIGRDASNTQRNFYYNLHGILVGGSDGSMIGLGKHTDTQVTSATSPTYTSLVVQTDNQCQFFALKAAGGSNVYSHSINLQKADAEGNDAPEGSVFNINLNIDTDTGSDTITVQIVNWEGSVLATITSNSSANTMQDILAYWDGSNWRLWQHGDTKTAGLAIA